MRFQLFAEPPSPGLVSLWLFLSVALVTRTCYVVDMVAVAGLMASGSDPFMGQHSVPSAGGSRLHLLWRAALTDGRGLHACLGGEAHVWGSCSHHGVTKSDALISKGHSDPRALWDQGQASLWISGNQGPAST